MRGSDRVPVKARTFGRTCAMGALVFAGLVAGGLASAADTDKKAAARDREQARRAQKMQQENAELKAKVKELGDKGEEASQALERAKREAAGVARELARTRKEGEEGAAARQAEYAAKAEAQENEKRELKGRLDETAARLAQCDREKRQLEDVVAAQVDTMGRQAGLIQSCRRDNAQLHGYATDLLQKFRAEGERSLIPVLGLREVETFNVYQEYRDKLDKLIPDSPRPTR
jgi:chromosome segregation ATPase